MKKIFCNVEDRRGKEFTHPRHAKQTSAHVHGTFLRMIEREKKLFFAYTLQLIKDPQVGTGRLQVYTSEPPK